MSAIIDLLTSQGLPLTSNRWFCPSCDPAQAKSKSVKFWNYRYSCYRCKAEGSINDAPQTFLGLAKPESTESTFGSHVETCNLVYRAYQRQSARAHEYLIDRGYPSAQVQTWHVVGFALGAGYLRSQGLSWSQLKAVGLTTEHNKELYRDRVVFPIRDRQGRLTHFQARSTDPDSTCKWLASKTGANQKPLSSMLWGADCLPTYAQQYGYVFLCEGLTDAYALKALGFPVIATFGIQNLKLLSYLDLFKGLRVIACYDNDRYAVGSPNAGLYKSWHWVLPQLTQLLGDPELGIEVYTFDIPNHSGVKDIFDLALALDWSAQDFESLVKQTALHIEDKALDVYGSDHLAALIQCFKYINPLTPEAQGQLEARVGGAGGWLEVLRSWDV